MALASPAAVLSVFDEASVLAQPLRNHWAPSRLTGRKSASLYCPLSSLLYRALLLYDKQILFSKRFTGIVKAETCRTEPQPW